MIHPFSIALVYGGKRSALYAQKMKNLIIKECSTLPVIPLLCDTSDNVYIMTAVKDVFEPSDYAIVFLTKAYHGRKSDGEGNDTRDFGMTTPNLMLEVGYLIKHIELENIRIIADFDYNTLTNTYAFPSDIAGRYVDCHPELAGASDEKVEETLTKILTRDLSAIKKKYHLSSKQDLELHYSPNFHDIFHWELFIQHINDYTLTKQVETIFNSWCSEIDEFQAMSSPNKSSYLMMYLYERLLYLMLFTGIQNLQFNRLKVPRDPSILSAEVEAYNDIIDYIRGGTKGKNASYFGRYIDRLSAYLQGLSSSNVLIQLLVKNYLGLSYLNRFLCEKANTNDLDSAEQCFNTVIQVSQERFSPADYELLQAYAYYNLARVQYEKHDPNAVWCTSFDIAIEYRNSLANSPDFPYCVQLYYKNELYHAQNAKIFHLCNSPSEFSSNNETVQNMLENEMGILDSLNTLEQTIVAGQPLFKSVKENAQRNISRLQDINKS